MLSTASRLARRAHTRALATGVAQKLDWAHLQSLVHSDEAKREVGKLKKLFEDTREALAVQSKVRSGATGWRGEPYEEALQRPSRRLDGPCCLALAAQRVVHAWTHAPAAAWLSEPCAPRRGEGEQRHSPEWPPARRLTPPVRPCSCWPGARTHRL